MVCNHIRAIETRFRHDIETLPSQLARHNATLAIVHVPPVASLETIESIGVPRSLYNRRLALYLREFRQGAVDQADRQDCLLSDLLGKSQAMIMVDFLGRHVTAP